MTFAAMSTNVACTTESLAFEQVNLKVYFTYGWLLLWFVLRYQWEREDHFRYRPISKFVYQRNEGYIYFFSPPNLAIFKYLFCIICESILFHLIIGSRYTGKYQFVHQIPYSVIKWQEHTFVENTIIKALCHSWCLGKMPNTLTIP